MSFGEYWEFDDFEVMRQSDELSREYEYEDDILYYVEGCCDEFED